MVDPNTRQGKRTPVTLKIKFKSETLEQFIERYAVDVSQGGIFIRTKEPLAVGTQMKFEFQLRDASPLIAGEGTVVWTRENDPSRPAIAPGMGVRFDRLGDGSQGVLEKILAEKAKQAPQRSATESPTKPPMFTDTPTRVAPAAVQDALLTPRGSTANTRARQDSEQTPLPRPMPFHSDAEDFGAEAFEEQTKVRSLDELAASTAADPDPKTATVIMPPDELALRRQAGRADSTSPLAEPPPPSDADHVAAERDSAPVLPNPPDSGSGRTPKMLDTTPSPRPSTPSQSPPTRPSSPSTPPLRPSESAQTKLGVEPARPARTSSSPVAKADTAEKTEKVESAKAVETPRPDAPSRPSSAPVVIGIVCAAAVALGGIWFFALRDKGGETPKPDRPVHDTPIVATSGSAGSSAAPITAIESGSATQEIKHDGSAAIGGEKIGGEKIGSAATAPPAPKLVDTEIASNVSKAIVTVVDTGQSGPVPFKAKLEKDKPYKVRIEALGFARAEIDVKGGSDKVTAKLVAKPRLLSVTSDPPGAQILIDNAATGKVTPFDVELTTAQAARPRVHVTLRKTGFRTMDQIVDSASFTEDDAHMTSKVEAKLAVMVAATPNTGTPTHTGNGNGSATPATGNGSGEKTGGNGSATPTGGNGSATPTGGNGSATPTGGEKTGGEKTGGEKTGGEKTGGEKTGGEKTGGEKTGGEKTGGETTPPKPPPKGDEPEPDPDWSKRQ